MQYHTAQKELNCCILDIRCALHIVLLVIPTTVCIQARVAFSNGKIMLMFLFKSSVYRPSGTSLLKVALFLV